MVLAHNGAEITQALLVVNRAEVAKMTTMEKAQDLIHCNFDTIMVLAVIAFLYHPIDILTEALAQSIH